MTPALPDGALLAVLTPYDVELCLHALDSASFRGEAVERVAQTRARLRAAMERRILQAEVTPGVTPDVGA